MHYDSPYNTKKRAADVDLSDRETEVQRTTRVPYTQPAIGKATLHFPAHLAGYDVDELDARAAAAVEPAYRWWGAR